MVRAPPAASFDPEACYVITGGLSGLGRSIIQWMSDRGARNLVVLSRRGGSAAEAQTLVDALAKRGVRVRPIACDLGDQEQVLHAIQEASATRPLKGIVHCAVSYQDISFDKLSLDGWRDGLAAKVSGTRNLHETTKTLPLDFFIMTTSILSVLSFATQGAYTAADNFQDQFARYRRRLGLPATAAQFGLVNDVGHLSTDTTTLELMARNKVMTLPESYFLRLLEPAFLGRDSPKGIETDPLAAATYVTYMDPAYMAAKKRDDTEMGISSATPPRWYGDARISQVIRAFDDAMQVDANGSGPAAEAEGGRFATARLRHDFEETVLRARAAPAETEQLEHRAHALELVISGIVATVSAMLLLEPSTINVARAVSDHGVDSLIAAELRNWFYVALGSKISMVDLLDSRVSISLIAAKVVDAAIKEKKEKKK
jgi:NAD(P)-dependent dehydrogenase (short-subunit alcohol dehydrogenase family)